MKNVADILPLTPMQNLMLMHSISMPGSSALATQFHYRISGNLDVDRFGSAWQKLIQRHEVLRTGFAWKDLRQPVQILRKAAQLDYRYTDLSGLQGDEQPGELARIQQQDRTLVFDLRKAPLFRVVLVRVQPDEHIMLWTRHHLILDRWCVDILFNELFSLYQGSELSNLPPAGQFRSYISWLARQDQAQAESYWRESLSGLVSPSLVAANARRRNTPGGSLSSIVALLDGNLYRRIKSLASELRISHAAVYQAAVALLLAEHCRQLDITFGMTVSGRPPELADVETAMGSYINNVLVYQKLDLRTQLDSWLRQLHTLQARRSRYDYVSLTDLQQWSGLAASTPLFDVLLLLDSPSTEVRQWEDLSIEQLQAPLDSAFPLTLGVADNAGQLELTAVFDPGTLAATLVNGLVNRLQTLLAEIATRPEAELGRYLSADLVDPPARRSSEPSPVNVQSDRDNPEAVLTALWQSVLGLDHIGPDDDFFALGGTSVQAALLFSQIERHFSKVLPLSALLDAGSVREFLALLEAPQPATPTLVSIQPLGSSPPLVVIPGIGGNVVGLAGLARAMGPEQPFYGLQSVGLDGREQPYSRIEDIARRYLAELEPIDGPPVLFGICWGAAVALEMAQQLAAAGQSPPLLVVMDPTYRSETPSGLPVATGSRAGYMFRFIRDRLSLYVSEFRQLQGPQRRAWLRQKWQLLLAIARAGDPFQGDRTEYNQRMVADANYRALVKYRPSVYGGKVVVMLTEDRSFGGAADPRQQWLQIVTSQAAVLNVCGEDTGNALSERHVASLAARLRQLVRELVSTPAASSTG